MIKSSKSAWIDHWHCVVIPSCRWGVCVLISRWVWFSPSEGLCFDRRLLLIPRVLVRSVTVCLWVGATELSVCLPAGERSPTAYSGSNIELLPRANSLAWHPNAVARRWGWMSGGHAKLVSARRGNSVPPPHFLLSLRVCSQRGCWEINLDLQLPLHLPLLRVGWFPWERAPGYHQEERELCVLVRFIHLDVLS